MTLREAAEALLDALEPWQATANIKSAKSALKAALSAPPERGERSYLTTGCGKHDLPGFNEACDACLFDEVVALQSRCRAEWLAGWRAGAEAVAVEADRWAAHYATDIFSENGGSIECRAAAHGRKVASGIAHDARTLALSPPEEPPECRACDGAGKCTCESAGCVASCSFCGGTGQRGGT